MSEEPMGEGTLPGRGQPWPGGGQRDWPGGGGGGATWPGGAGAGPTDGEASYGQASYAEGAWGWKPNVEPPRPPAPSQQGYEGWSQPPPPLPPAMSGEAATRRRRRGAMATTFVVTALLSGAAGAGIALAVNNQPSTSQSTASLPTASQDKGPVPLNTNIDIRAVAQKVEPATVDITASDPGGQQDEGTGMVLTRSGLVLTNNHVVEGSTSLVAQVDGAGRKYPVTVLGVDPSQDVALLQLHGGSAWKTLRIGNSNAVSVGDAVLAIGNALALPGPETVTYGIISATSRSITVSDPSAATPESLRGLFQTSAAISSGDSGGPLVDAAGQVIGMDTAAASGNGSGVTASDVGFAIPINRAMSIARLILDGKASSTIDIGTKAIMGVKVLTVACSEGEAPGCQNLGAANPFSGPFSGFFGSGEYTAPASKGAVVTDLVPGSPAAQAGLAIGDVITSLDGKAVSTPLQLTAALKGDKVGQDVTVGWVATDSSRHTAGLRLMSAPTP